MATVVLERVNDQWKFIVSAIAGIIGFIITLIFVPGNGFTGFTGFITSQHLLSRAEVASKSPLWD